MSSFMPALLMVNPLTKKVVNTVALAWECETESSWGHTDPYTHVYRQETPQTCSPGSYSPLTNKIIAQNTPGHHY